MYMSKNVALSDDAVEILDRLKRNGESYSEVVKRVAIEKPTRTSWRDSVGVFKDDKEAKKVFGDILDNRHTVKKRKDLIW